MGGTRSGSRSALRPRSEVVREGPVGPPGRAGRHENWRRKLPSLLESVRTTRSSERGSRGGVLLLGLEQCTGSRNRENYGLEPASTTDISLIFRTAEVLVVATTNWRWPLTIIVEQDAADRRRWLE